QQRFVLVNAIDDGLNALELTSEARPNHLCDQLFQHASSVRYNRCDVMYAATSSGTMALILSPAATARRTPVAVMSGTATSTRCAAQGRCGVVAPGRSCTTMLASVGSRSAWRQAGRSRAAAV